MRLVVRGVGARAGQARESSGQPGPAEHVANCALNARENGLTHGQTPSSAAEKRVLGLDGSGCDVPPGRGRPAWKGMASVEALPDYRCANCPTPSLHSHELGLQDPM